MAGAAGTADYNPAGNSDFSRKAMEQAEALLQWTAPSATDGERGGTLTEAMTGSSLTQQVNSMWMAPTAQNHKGSSQGSIRRKDGKSRADLLHYQAEIFFQPSFLAQPIPAAGSTCSTDIPNTNQPLVKRRLNPIFVEALMRWPTGLSGFARPETAWTRWWQLMPSFLSMLVSSVPAPMPDLFGD